jgi:hypothetical protein
MRLLIGQPLAMPLTSLPVWQNGTPQSMQRAPWVRRCFFVHVAVKFLPVATRSAGSTIFGLAEVLDESGWFSHGKEGRSFGFGSNLRFSSF